VWTFITYKASRCGYAVAWDAGTLACAPSRPRNISHCGVGKAQHDLSAPETRRTVVKLAASMRVWARAALQSSEFPANANSASAVRTAMRREDMSNLPIWMSICMPVMIIASHEMTVRGMLILRGCSPSRIVRW
jgi:hypothetical protein